MPTPADFPTAEKVSVVAKIDGKFYRKVTNSEGQRDPKAIRAKLANSNGEAEIKWFVPLDIQPAETDSEAA